MMNKSEIIGFDMNRIDKVLKEIDDFSFSELPDTKLVGAVEMYFNLSKAGKEFVKFHDLKKEGIDWQASRFCSLKYYIERDLCFESGTQIRKILGKPVRLINELLTLCAINFNEKHKGSDEQELFETVDFSYDIDLDVESNDNLRLSDRTKITNEKSSCNDFLDFEMLGKGTLNFKLEPFLFFLVTTGFWVSESGRYKVKGNAVYIDGEPYYYDVEVTCLS